MVRAYANWIKVTLIFLVSLLIRELVDSLPLVGRNTEDVIVGRILHLQSLMVAEP